MAIITIGPITEQIKGSIGGVTFTNSKQGPFVRKRYKPRNPKSGYQSVARQGIQIYSKSWYLPTVNHDAWNTWAFDHPVQNRLGKTVKLSGYQWFVEFNIIAAIAGVTTLVLAPPITSTVFPSFLTCTVIADHAIPSITGLITYGGLIPVGGLYEILATPQLSAGVYTPHSFKLVSVVTPPPSGTSFDFTTNYITRFSPLFSGSKVFINVRIILPSGESSLWIKGSGITA